MFSSEVIARFLSVVWGESREEDNRTNISRRNGVERQKRKQKPRKQEEGGIKRKRCWDWEERATRWDEEEGRERQLRGIWRWHKSKFKYIIHGSLCQNIIYVCCVDSWLVKWEGHEKKERMGGNKQLRRLLYSWPENIKKCTHSWLIRHRLFIDFYYSLSVK